MAGLAEAARGRADEHEIAVPGPLDLAQEGRAVRNVAVRFARSVASQRSSGSSQTGSSARGQTPATAAQTSTRPSASRARANSALDLRLVGEIRAERERARQLGRERFGALAAAAVVDDDARAFRRERPRARGADAAGGAGDEDALAVQPGLQAEPNRGAAHARCLAST